MRGPTEAGPRWQLTLDGVAVLLDAVPARARQAPDPAVVAAFWARVVPTPGCWYWIGGYSHDGYGALHDIGLDGPRNRHRLNRGGDRHASQRRALPNRALPAALGPLHPRLRPTTHH